MDSAASKDILIHPIEPPAGVEDTLVLAIIHSSNAPLVLLDGALTIIAVSNSFSHAFGLRPVSVGGRKMADLGAGEWNVPQLESLLAATASGHAEIDAYEMDLKRPGTADRRLILNARKLDYNDTVNARILLTVMDVTDARIAEKLKDDLLREKGILLRELQHRVANSLQIVASVLLQSAKRTQSEETRSHLHDAHQRVMSVASLQTQLAASLLRDVELRSYFTDLCRSIGASMIRDHNQISLDVATDDSVTHADVSISLGLIVTELVINALKHAFPGGRIGKIKVGYKSHDEDWTLSVTDDGVGMPDDKEASTPGLGTSIVNALAHQLGATVETADHKPGHSVSIVHH